MLTLHEIKKKFTSVKKKKNKINNNFPSLKSLYMMEFLPKHVWKFFPNYYFSRHHIC